MRFIILLKERAGAGPDPSGAHPGAGRVRRKSVLRARARTRARPDGHETRGRSRAPGAREPARAARRPPRAIAHRDRRRRALRRRARSADSWSWWRPPMAAGTTFSRLLNSAAREGVIELDDSRPSVRAPVARIDLLRAGETVGSGAPSTGSRQEEVADLEERARHMALVGRRARRLRRVPARRRGRAGCSTRRLPPPRQSSARWPPS